MGYELGVDLQGYYDQYTLTWKAPIAFGANVSGFGLSQFEQYEWTFYTPEGQGVNFANAMPDANYSVSANVNSVAAANSANATSYLASSVAIQTTQNGSLADFGTVSVSVFR